MRSFLWQTRRWFTVGHQRGLTLIELTVAVSIFLLILVGIFQVFDPSRDAYQVSEHKLVRQRH
jgi:prepilin-type N-terminal cleavage/methylation domain-containing protein